MSTFFMWLNFSTRPFIVYSGQDFLACDTFKESWLLTFYDFFPKTVARDQGHSDPETIYDTMLPQGVSTVQSLESYVNTAASKQNLSSHGW